MSRTGYGDSLLKRNKNSTSTTSLDLSNLIKSVDTIRFDTSSFVDDLKCSVCLDFFNQPRTLACQHSFCTTCLER